MRTFAEIAATGAAWVTECEIDRMVARIAELEAAPNQETCGAQLKTRPDGRVGCDVCGWVVPNKQPTQRVRKSKS